MRSARLKALLALATALVLGGVVGMAVMHAWDVRRFTRTLSLRAEDRDAYVLQVLTRELQLSADQRERILQLKAASRPRGEEIFRRIYPEVLALEDVFIANVNAILTPAQQRRFGELMQIQKARLRRQAGLQ